MHIPRRLPQTRTVSRVAWVYLLKQNFTVDLEPWGCRERTPVPLLLAGFNLRSVRSLRNIRCAAGQAPPGLLRRGPR